MGGAEKEKKREREREAKRKRQNRNLEFSTGLCDTTVRQPLNPFPLDILNLWNGNNIGGREFRERRMT